MPAQTVIKLRRDTAANWDSVNPVLAAGEMGVETDTGLHKIGDGSSAWGALQYAASSKIATQVKNTSGSSIPKGSVVYISGATGGDALISLADADLEMTSSKTLGFTSAAIANDAFGTVIEQGLLSGVDTSTATAGQAVYLSTTSGGYVFGAPPAKPAHSVYLGVVVRVHATEGEILVKVQNGYELNELHDVDAGDPTPGEFLQWDGSAWVNAVVDIPPGTIISDTAPTGIDAGTVWYNSAEGTPYIYYDNTWVEFAPAISPPATTVAVTAPLTNSGTEQDVILGIDRSQLAGVSHNYIINGAFDIWQRGTSGTASGTHTADRWYNNSDTTFTCSQQTFTPGTIETSVGDARFFLRLAKNAGGTFGAILQFIEDVRTLAGQSVTLSFWAKAGSAISFTTRLSQNFGSGGSSVVTAGSTTHSLTTSWQRFTYTVTMPSISGKTIGTNSFVNLEMFIATSSASTIDLWGVQLEAGSVATPFKRNANSLQGELAACQRYAFRLDGQGNTGYAPAASTTVVNRVPIALPVEMRANPTISTLSGTPQLFDGINAPINITSLSSPVLSQNQFKVDVSVASGLTQYRSYTIFLNSAIILLSSEL